MESNTGFNVGDSSAVSRVSHGSRFCQRAESEGTTEGVWMSAVEAEGEKENLFYLILDFEGLGLGSQLLGRRFRSSWSFT